jgi:O-antigen/teichoic acid export membrane protein
MIPGMRTPEILRGLVTNTSWLLGERILRVCVNLAVGIYVARYLGPGNFGALSYALSFTGLFSVFVLLGLPRILIRELVRTPEQTGRLLGTAGGLMALGGLAALGLLAATVPALDISPVERWMILIIGSGLVFQAGNVLEFHFQAVMQTRQVATAQALQLGVSALVRIALILARADLVWFAAAAALDNCLTACTLTIQYRRSRLTAQPWRFSTTTAVALLKNAWPLMLSTIAVTVYMKVDQVMLRSILGADAVGQYAAAVRISEGWYFIPVAITAAVFPAVLNARQAGNDAYLAKIQSLFNVMVWLAVAIALPMTFLSGIVVTLLYGSAYLPAAPILTVHIWAAVFVFTNNALQQWYIAEGLEKLAAVRTGAGLILNIALNLLLIPAYGAIGAAWATLVSRAMVGFLINFIFSNTRPMFWMIFRSLALGLVPGKT